MKLIKFQFIAINAIITAFATSPVWASDRIHKTENPVFAEIIGLIAGFGTTFAAMPDLLVMLQNRSTKGMNPRMAAIMGSFQTLWLVYGLTIDAPAVIFWNAIAIVINGTTVGAYYYFGRLDKKR
ncbi:MAG: SemiSWEET family transporter [Hydrococcus sp. Prado102]|jgi:MtN3 and saliva related transmembrane protein|nr:SemiSWEET family transporter [Hydrococcus sp. Prado102]